MKSVIFRMKTIWEDRRRRLILGLCLLLAAGVAVVYAQVGGFYFVDYDDPFYVTGNPHVPAGLKLEGIKWAFTTMHAGNWFPLVWLSLMVDSSLFGVRAGGFHLVNIALHIANSILLFWVLRRYTKALWASFFVAALFALHPLHVESVAWVTERKDVLSTLFWLLTMLAYLRYVEVPSVKRYVIICASFAFGLMSKSMLVTLPFVLLLMDYWPLERNGGLKWLIIEKIPLFVLSALVCVITVIAQKGVGAVAKVSLVPWGERIGNALVSYCDYILKTFWPVELAVFYPYPASSIAGWKVAASFVILAGVTIFVIVLRRRRYLLIGWLWYLGTLVPVIGIVQVGAQAFADRYTYMPLTGIFIMLVWFVSDILAQLPLTKKAAGVAGSAIIGVLGVMSFVQTGYWRDTLTLFEHCAAVTPDNVIARKYLGIGFARKGDAESALHEFKESLRFEPNDTRTFYNIGNMLVLLDRFDEAIEYYNRLLELKPNDADTYGALASINTAKGQLGQAAELYRKGLRYNSGDAVLHKGFGLLLLRTGRVDDAIKELEQAAKLGSDSSVYCNLGIAYAAKRQMKTAMECYSKAIRLDPANAEAHYNFGNAYLVQNVPMAASMEYQEAILARPDYANAYCNMAAALMKMGRIDEAVSNFRRSVEIEPNNPDWNFNLASALAKKGLLDEAIEQMRKVIRLVPADTGARCELAGMLLQKGESAEAMAEYQEVLKVNPTDKNALAGLEKVKAGVENKSQQ
jgi:protein O-mannosyl-transferase